MMEFVSRQWKRQSPPGVRAGNPRRRWGGASIRRMTCCGVVFVLLVLTGCNQNSAFRGLSPWGTAPATPPAANATPPANATAAAAAPATPPKEGALGPGLLGRQTYITDLQRRADEQTRLAEEQRRRLAELQELQRVNEEQLAKLRNEQLAARSEEREQDERRDAMLASRAREAVSRYDEINRRAQKLDQANRNINAEIARVQQQNQILEDQNNLLRRRLDETSQQLHAAIEQTKNSQEKLTTMVASARRRGGATITANSSYRRSLTAVTVAGLNIRQDGEVVRIELPSDRLFETGTARLRAEGPAIIDQVAGVITKHYPRQVIGVEAHSDNSPLGSTQWRNAHQLTAAQAMSVFEHLSYRHAIRPQQMFVLGHGDNYPLSSNGTAAGQARNRRVEIVIYPETVGQRR